MILLILFLVVFVECKNFKMSANICLPRAGKTVECHGEFNNNCNNFVCTKNKYTCQMLLFSFGLKGEHKRKHESFIKEIKECSMPPKYKWKSNDACFNANDCVTTLMSIWSFRQIKSECKCQGIYSYKCNRDYCALNKLACQGLKKNKLKLKKCLKK
jgi:hypothetical protein